MSERALSQENPAELRPAVLPSHGKGMLRPFVPGQTGNPQGKSGAYLETQRLARAHSVEVMERLIQIALNDKDTRVATVAGNSVLDRALGKPKDYDPNSERPNMIVDLSKLTSKQLDQLQTILASGAFRPAEPDAPGDVVVIEGEQGG